jgi:aldose 1-epimerase
MSENVKIKTCGIISEYPFGQLKTGEKISKYCLTNNNKLSVNVLNYGGILQSIKTPDLSGNFSDILLGYDNLEGYLEDESYMGAVIGRFANRIAGGTFVLDNTAYPLTKNDGINCIHGGQIGFNRVVWEAEKLDSGKGEMLLLSHNSPHGDQGFPGNLSVSALYALNDDNELNIRIRAMSDRKTVINVSLHPYFNLSGTPASDLDSHLLSIEAQKYLPINEHMVPTGEIRSVANSVFDFRNEIPIHSRIVGDNSQLTIAGGFDHCFIINEPNGSLRSMAVLEDIESGRSLTLSSNAPAMQLYTANFLNGSVKGKGGISFDKWQAVCLEPEEYPNSPRENKFPSPVLEANDEYDHQIQYKFDVLNK